jgi:hypothetical protein
MIPPFRPTIAHLALVVITSAGAARADKPPGLACVERYFGARGEAREGRWEVVLPDGTRLPWEAPPGARSFEQILDRPAPADMFAPRYSKGAIRPVETVDEDPGRVRVEALFRLAYPRRGLAKIEVFGKKREVHDKIAAPLARVAERLARAVAADPTLQPFLSELGGTFNDRVIAGTTRPSAHAFGIALDINPSRSDYWRWQKGGPGKKIQWKNRVPQAIVDAFEAEGFIWGGRWYHFDTMHFEYRPELLDPTCYPDS